MSITRGIGARWTRLWTTSIVARWIDGGRTPWPMSLSQTLQVHASSHSERLTRRLHYRLTAFQCETRAKSSERTWPSRSRQLSSTSTRWTKRRNWCKQATSVWRIISHSIPKSTITIAWGRRSNDSNSTQALSISALRLQDQTILPQESTWCRIRIRDLLRIKSRRITQMASSTFPMSRSIMRGTPAKP